MRGGGLRRGSGALLLLCKGRGVLSLCKGRDVLCDRPEARSLVLLAECGLLEEGLLEGGLLECGLLARELLKGPLELQGGRRRDTGVTLRYRGTAWHRGRSWAVPGPCWDRNR